MCLSLVADVKSPVNVREWLEGLELSQYENTFITNGFDDVNYLVRPMHFLLRKYKHKI